MFEEIKKESFTVKETFEILKGLGLTKSEQVVRRWIRGEVPGKELKSTPPPKGATKVGHRIKKEDLEAFILQHKKIDVDEVFQGNKKSNKKIEEEDNKKVTKDFSDLVEEKYQESIEKFEELTEEGYEKLMYSLSSLFVENKELRQQIQQLKEENEELQLQADKVRVTKEERMVLKGLGVSVGEILKHSFVSKDESVGRLSVTELDGLDKISVSFSIKNEMYSAVVQPTKRYFSDEKPLSWEVAAVKKISSNRPLGEKKVQAIAYDVLHQTFLYLYEQESNKKQAFQYLF